MRAAHGWLPDPPKPSDWAAGPHLAMRAGVTPYAFSNRHLVASVLDQGGLGSCVLNAVAQIIRAAMVRQLIEEMHYSLQDAHAKAELPSRLFLYFFARATTGDTKVDSGTWLRNAFDIVNSLGFCAEEFWPYDDATGPDAKFTHHPSQEACREAYDQRSAAPGNQLIEYRRIFEEGDDRIPVVKQALADGYLVGFGTDVSKAFCNSEFDPNRPIEPPANDGEVAGGHAMCWTGYNGDNFDTLNSWGPNFANGGYVTFSPRYVASSRTRDLWIVKRAPLLVAA